MTLGAVALLGTCGCVRTTTSERDLGAPSSFVREDPLPGPPELEAVVSRSGGSLELELSRVRWCRRQEITKVRRVKVEESKLSAGTAVASSVVMGVGVIAMNVAVFAVGGAFIGVGLLRSGTTTTELPERESAAPGKRVVCQRAPAAGVVVQVTVDAALHQGVSDERGKLSIADVERGRVRVAVDGEPVRARRGEQQRAKPPALEAKTQEPRETPEPQAQSQPKPQPQPKPKPKPKPAAPSDAALPLPPPPPPPPGVRLFPE
ncbi:MAG: hypothetical protein IPM35_12115 [Myxococcales bacterium]|nr:hypothetical protein [Myxococcales bacterium]